MFKMPDINEAARFIKKLEACESMAAKLVLLRGFCDKYAAGLPIQQWAASHPDLPQRLWTEERRQFEAYRQSQALAQPPIVKGPVQ